MTRVALATARQARDLDHDAPLLIAALADRNIDAQLCVWDDQTVDWAAYQLVVLRSTWDYPKRRDAFVRWVERVDQLAGVCNSPDVVAWNSDKRYLLELAAQAVPVVPSQVAEPGHALDLPADRAVVVKPTVSAGAQDTFRFDPHQHDEALEHAAALHADGRGVLVQPYLVDVDEHGETALIYFGGTFSHAIRKGPILASAPDTVGGLFAAEQIDRRDATPVERTVAGAALDALPFAAAELLYARVDVLPSSDGPLVLEVELVEPSLFLAHHENAPERFAQVIAGHLSATP